MPNIQDVGNTNTDPFSLFSCLFLGIFGPFAQPIVTYIGWVFFSNPFNTQNHLSWVGWYLQKNQWDSLQEIMKGWCSSMWNPPNRNGKPLWRDGQEWKPLIMKYHHFESRSNMIFHADSNQKNGRVSDENMKKHLLGRGRGYYNLPIYFLESLVSTVLPKC